MKKPYILLTFLFMITAFYLKAQQNIQVNSTLITPPCNDDAVASVTINGGISPYTVYWLRFGGENPGMMGYDTVATGEIATGLSPGYYQIHVYDATGAQGFSGIFIQPPFQATHMVTPATCSNSNGMAKVIIANTTSGPYSFVWSTGQISLNQSLNMDSIVNIPAGNYSVVISNGEGCSYTYGVGQGSTSNQGITVWANSPIQSTSTATPSNCFDGTATVNPTNGTAPYTYLWNTNPVQMSQTATGLSPGTYQCLITDDAGCTRNAWVTVPAGPNFLQSLATVVNPTCTQSNGSITISISGGQAPYSVSWSTGATGSVLSNVPAGFYTATISDAAGCSLQIHKSLTASSPVNVTISTTPAACNNTGATATANVTGGQSPYTYTWFGGGNTATLTNLASGNYYVTVTDANGCTGSDYASNPLPQSCFGVISGRVISDLNGDCSLNGNESGIANVLINASPGYHYATTNAQGFYSISVPPGNYLVHQYVPSNWTQLCPTGDIAVNVPGAGSNSTGNIFYNQPNDVFNNLRVTVNLGFARPGFQNLATIAVQNIGVTSLTPTLTYTHDALFNYNFANPAPAGYNAATQTVTWNVGVINPNQWKYFYVTQTLPPSAVSQIGDSVYCTAEVSITGVDIDLSNNTYTAARLITGSYDPNDKLVFPVGETDEGRVDLSVTEFFYRIRFQNTGNDTAFTVVIRDTLDFDLDVTSFRFDAASHPVEYEITGEGFVTFTFNNILLPDSTTNEPLSHGAVSYYISRKPETTYGTRITNTASIYFDFNPPIVTNTTVNTLYDFTIGIVSNENQLVAKVFPNPTTGLLSLSLNADTNQPLTYQLLSTDGRIIHSKALNLNSNSIADLDLNAMQIASGLYILSIQQGEKSARIKIQKF